MKPSLIYSLKVWLTAVLGGPAIEALCNTFKFYGHVVLFDAVMSMSIVFGLVLTIPGWLISWQFVAAINRKPYRNRVKKLLLNALGIIVTLLTFYLLNPSQPLWSDILKTAWPYLMLVTAGIWLYKLQTVTAEADPVGKAG